MGRTAGRTFKTQRLARRPLRSNLDISSHISCVDFAKDKLGIPLWPAQETILRAFYGLPLVNSEQEDFFVEATRDVYGESYKYEPGRELRSLAAILGRRSGKSRAIAAPIIIYEGLRDWSSFLKGMHEYVFSIFMAEAIPQARDVLGTEIVATILNVPDLAKEVVYHDSGRKRAGVEDIETTTTDQLVLSNRTIIKALPPDPGKVRGRPIICLAADEIAWWKKEGAYADKDIMRALRPSLLQFKGHARVLELSSPGAKQGVLWESFCRAKETRDFKIVFKAGTLLCNPTVDKAFIEQEIGDDPVLGAIEYGAEFADSIDALIPRELLMACVGQYAMLPREYKQVYMTAIDPSGSAKNTGDPLGMCAAHFDVLRRKVVVDRATSWEKTSAEYLPGVIDGIVSICDAYGTKSILQDQFAAEWVALALIKVGLSPVRRDWTRKLRVACGEKLRGLVDQQRLEIPNDVTLIDDILSLQRVILDSGVMSIKKSRRSFRHGDLADCVMQLSYYLDQGAGDLPSTPEQKVKQAAFAAKMQRNSPAHAVHSGRWFGGKVKNTATLIKSSKYYGGPPANGKPPWRD